MRLKTYTAASMAEAMAMVRGEMGENAIIVSTQKSSGANGVRVTAAQEPADHDFIAGTDTAEAMSPDDIESALRHVLIFHGVPRYLCERIVGFAADTSAGEPIQALAAALELSFLYKPLGAVWRRPLMLVGPPGAGKTIATAKIVARAAMRDAGVSVISTDTQRAGGIEQLAAFTRILKTGMISADGPDELAKAVKAAGGRPVVIDTAAANPFGEAEMDRLNTLVQAAGAEPLLVMAAGGDAMEMADVAVSYRGLGVERLLATRIDIARRLGGIIAAADAAQLAFSDVSVTPHIGDGLSPLDPMALARLIMPHSHATTAHKPRTEAAS